MRIDRDGNELRQVSVWLPITMIELMHADGFNVSRFIRDQIAILYRDPSGQPLNDREQLVAAARESIARQLAAEAEREADRERARVAVRTMRAERDAMKARQDGITEALTQLIGDGSPGTVTRLLPENDPYGDRIVDWENLVRRVSRLCGAEVDSAEVADGLRALAAKP